MADEQEMMGQLRDDQNDQRGRSRARKSGSGKRAAAIAGGSFLAALLVCGGVYGAVAQKYRHTYLPGTTINGVAAGGRTVDAVKQELADHVGGYVLTLTERGDKSERIAGSDIDLKTEFDGTLEQLLSSQSPYLWLSRKLNPKTYSIRTAIDYDEKKLDSLLKDLDCANPDKMTAPVDAKISEYVAGEGFHIIPETEGTLADPEKLETAVSEALTNLTTTLDLDAAGVYMEPAVREADQALTDKLAQMNKIAQMHITYKFGDNAETLDGATIYGWITADQSAGVSVDEAKAAAYVKELAKKYDTSGKPKKFHTSYGTDVTVSGGSYGWKINQADETAQLITLIKAGESTEREPIYSRTAASRSEDIGDTYVEVNLTGQHLFYYKGGKLVLESDFVSGNTSLGRGTPNGVYTLTYKQKDAVLKGENYRTPVSYWMPFNGGIGFHDANWRSAFGGTIYKTGGSHGCINMPFSAAKNLFSNISAGCVVVCYGATGTEHKSTTPAAGVGASTAATESAAETAAQNQNPAGTAAAPGTSQQAPAPGQPAAQSPAAPAPSSGSAPGEVQQQGPVDVPKPGTNPGAGPSGSSDSAPGDSSGNGTQNGPGNGDFVASDGPVV